MACQAPTATPPRAPARVPTCAHCTYLRSLLADQRTVLHELMAGMVMILGAHRYARQTAELAARPMCDMEVERLVLGVSLRRGIAPPPALFTGFTHPELAAAINTGQLDPVLLSPVMTWYRRDLMAIPCTPGELSYALDQLMDLAAERAAIAAAELAVQALRGPGGADCARAALQRALDALAPEGF